MTSVSTTDLTASVAAIRELFGAAACSCALADDAGEQLRFVAADGAGAREILGVQIPVSRGIAGWAAMSGQPIAVRDVRTDARFARDVAESTNYVPTAILAAPLLSPDGEVLGVVEVLDPQVDEGSDWTLTVLGTLASHMAMLVEHHADDDSPLAQLGAEVLRAVGRYRAEER